MNFKTEISIADIINILVASGTFIVIYLTKKSLKAAYKSTEAAIKSAEAAELSIEQMKDTLMPYLSLDLTNEDNSLFVTIQNVGPGLGTIRLVTVREDIRIESVLSPTEYWSSENKTSDTRMCDFVIGSEKEYTFRLQKSQRFDPEAKYWLSSLSVFYEDVYGRHYLARVIYTLSKENDKLIAETIGKENLRVEKLPLSPNDNININQIYNLEGGRPTLYRPQFKSLHYQKFISQIVNKNVEGTHFTGNQNVAIRAIEFPWHGYPVFRIQIGDNIPFRLEQVIQDGHPVGYRVSGTSPNLNYPTFEQVEPYSKYGLIPEGNDEPNIRELYNKILNQLVDNPNSYNL